MLWYLLAVEEISLARWTRNAVASTLCMAPPWMATGRNPKASIQHQPFIPFYATRATCHQKAAATADKIDSSGTAQAQPKQRPVQLAPANAANNPKGLRMACPWPPDQIQLQSSPQRGQRLQPPPQISFRSFPAVTTTSSTGLPVRSVRVLPAGSTVH